MNYLNIIIGVLKRIAFALIISLIIYKVLYSVAFAERGYHALGGEALLSVTLFFAILFRKNLAH